MVKNVDLDGKIYLDLASVRLTRKSWTEFLLWGLFQSSRRDKMPKIKYGNLHMSAHNYHRFTIFMYIHMF